MHIKEKMFDNARIVRHQKIWLQSTKNIQYRVKVKMNLQRKNMYERHQP